jgi:hypothetical protein
MNNAKQPLLFIQRHLKHDIHIATIHCPLVNMQSRPREEPEPVVPFRIHFGDFIKDITIFSPPSPFLSSLCLSSLLLSALG